MNIAILIMAHKNEVQLDQLIGRLVKDFTVYLHIDKKSPLQIQPSKNLIILTQFPVFWGRYTQIKTSLHMLEQAVKGQHQRYILISGQDLPIKSNRKIISFFRNNSKNYIEYFKLPRKNWGGGEKIERLSLFHRNREYHPPIINKITIRIERKIQNLQKRCNLYRKIPEHLYGGANWFNLTHDAVDLILKSCTQNYLKFYKNTLCADEIIIQSILLNSYLRETCRNDSLRYIDWTSGPEHPRIIRQKDLESIKNSDALFARKFDANIDNNVIQNILEFTT